MECLCFFGDFMGLHLSFHEKFISLYERCLWNFIRLIFLWILRGVPSNINMGNHKQNPNTKSIKIHPVPGTTHYGAAGSYEHLPKQKQHQKRCSKQAKERNLVLRTSVDEIGNHGGWI